MSDARRSNPRITRGNLRHMHGLYMRALERDTQVNRDRLERWLQQYVVTLLPYDAATATGVPWQHVPYLEDCPLAKWYVRARGEALERIARLRSPDAVYGDVLAQTRSVRDLKILRDLLDKTDGQLFEELLSALKG